MQHPYVENATTLFDATTLSDTCTKKLHTFSNYLTAKSPVAISRTKNVNDGLELLIQNYAPPTRKV